MAAIKSALEFINDSDIMILTLTAWVGFNLRLSYETFGWLLMAAAFVVTALRRLECELTHRQVKPLFRNQLKPDGSWKVPTMERIRR